MFIVGLTGGIACGKSAVADLVKRLGVPVIDSDLIARQVVEPGCPAHTQLKNEFGVGYFDLETDELLREKLGELIFSDGDSRRRLNAITHPAIRNVIFKQLLHFALRGHQFVVLDAPLLYETGTDHMCQKVLVVRCSESVQLDRLMMRNGLTESEAKQRIQAQMSIEEKCQRATIVINNDGSLEDLECRIDSVTKTLLGPIAQLYNYMLQLRLQPYSNNRVAQLTNVNGLYNYNYKQNFTIICHFTTVPLLNFFAHYNYIYKCTLNH